MRFGRFFHKKNAAFLPDSPCTSKPGHLSEGQLREQLAAYFITSPPLSRQTPEQKAETAQALELLWQTEVQSVRHCRGLPRPLAYGDLSATLLAIAQAAQLLIGQQRLTLYAPLPRPLYAAFEPRLLQLAVVGLLRAVCHANPAAPVQMAVTHTAGTVSILVTGSRPVRDPATLSMVKETARLHQGSLAVCGGTIGFSLRTTLSSERPYTAPTADELLQNLVSGVCAGLYRRPL